MADTDTSTTTDDATSTDTTTSTTPTTGAASTTTEDATSTAVTDQLGDAGKRALEAERTARREAEKRAKSTEAELAKLRESQMSETEKAIQTARAEGRAEARTVVLKAQVIAAATGKLVDPNVAVKLLDLTQFEPDTSGEFNTDAIAEAISDLVTKSPYLAASQPGAKPAPGSANGGPQGGGPAQWTETDLEGKTPEQIEAARKSGLLNTLLGIT